MHPDFWQQRWREGRTGFHQDRPTPLLEQYWSEVFAPQGCRVLVPLCGKSLDLLWLAGRGHRVLGVELSPIAVQQFFTEHRMTPGIHVSPSGTHYACGPIEVVVGDAFALDDTLLASCQAVFDRAALIALPAPMRREYAYRVYARMAPGTRALVVDLEYPQDERQGPPFSVDAAEMRALFGERWAVDLLERRDILDEQPGFRSEGLTSLHTSAWRLLKRT
jgi:thiopurine S-methyltransferase